MYKKILILIYTIHVLEKKINNINNYINFKSNKIFNKLEKNLLLKVKFINKVKLIINKYLKLINLNKNKKNICKKANNIYYLKFKLKKNKNKKYIIYEKIKYLNIKIKFYLKNIKTYRKKIKKFKKRYYICKKNIYNNYLFLKYLKNKDIKYINYLKIKLNKINIILKYFKKKVKNNKIYKKYKLLKNNTKDNIGVVSVYKNMALKNTYLILPIQIYLNLFKYNKIYYDDYTGKIIINDRISNYVNIKINKLLKNI
ncbi:MAG: hypothetical protein NHG05_00935 [Candidatus Shikimatogenerans bostrichidophilus]|nr:MAG: hypothetical protein NHG05_00935 [Candidatus Shikimatogenerans bostrichidophilus]